MPNLELLLEFIAHGDVSDDYLDLLAKRLSRIDAKANDKEKEKFKELAKITIHAITARIFEAMDPNTGSLPPFNDINEPNKERKALVAELTNSPNARKYLCELNAGYVRTLMPGEDNLISKGFSIEEAKQTVDAFEEYVNSHRDEIEALQIIYSGKPINHAMLEDLSRTLQNANAEFEPHRLWNSYSLVLPPDKVKHFKNEERNLRNLLTNLIQMVRYAYRQIEKLDTLHATANQYFNLWCGQAQRELTEDQKQIFTHIKDYIVANGSCTIEEYQEVDEAAIAWLIINMGGKSKVKESLLTLSQFIIYQKAA